MNLEKMNGEYLSLKQTLEKENDKYNEYEEKINTLTDDIILWESTKVSIKRDASLTEEEKKTKTQEADQKILEIREQIKKIKEELIDRKANLEKIKGEIDAKIAEIKENPEMKKHLDTVLKKKYERKLAKVEKEKEELIEKKDKVEQIKQLTTEHPALANNLKGMISAYKTAESLKKELKELESTTENGIVEYKDPERANKIINELLPEAESKMQTNKAPFMDYIQKNKLNIEEKDVNELVEKGIINKNGKVDLENTFVKTTSRLNRQIKGLNKSIEDYTFAIDGKGTIETAKPRREQQENREQMNEKKPKWFQFIKRFRAWRDRRNQPELPEGGQETPSAERKKTKSSKDEFADSLKYDVIQDITKQMQKEELKEAKETRRENSDPER